jgi:hypothetical protein
LYFEFVLASVFPKEGTMRFHLLLVSAIAIFAVSVQAASPRPIPPAPTSLTCSASTASSLGESITNAINSALLPNATNTINNSSKNPYWSFTVPNYCWSNVLGFGLSVSCYPIV